MKVGPKIEASRKLETTACLNSEWKIAAIQNTGDFLRWTWFGEFENKTMRRAIQEAIFGLRPRISACQGPQFVDGIWRQCLYVRAWPGR